VCGEMYSRLATAPFVSPSATSSDTARSVAVRLCQPSAGRRRGPRGAGRTPRARNCARTARADEGDEELADGGHPGIPEEKGSYVLLLDWPEWLGEADNVAALRPCGGVVSSLEG